MAGIIVQTQPSAEPISLAQAKKFLRVFNTDDDDLISGLITAAREEVENFTNRSFGRTTTNLSRHTLDSY